MNSNPVLFTKIDMNEFISWKSAVALQLAGGRFVARNGMIRRGFVSSER